MPTLQWRHISGKKGRKTKSELPNNILIFWLHAPDLILSSVFVVSWVFLAAEVAFPCPQIVAHNFTTLQCTTPKLQMYNSSLTVVWPNPKFLLKLSKTKFSLEPYRNVMKHTLHKWGGNILSIHEGIGPSNSVSQPKKLNLSWREY